jgi:hypothetical protein
MKQRVHILTCLFFVICTGIEAQDRDVNFEAHLQEMPFPEFVLQLEKQTGAKFYYLEDWIKDIRI